MTANQCGHTADNSGRPSNGGGSVRRAKKASIRVRSHIWNRPKFCRLLFLKIGAPHASCFSRPAAMELALDNSAASRYCFVCTTHYLKATTTMTNDTVHGDGFQKNCDGQSMSDAIKIQIQLWQIRKILGVWILVYFS